MNEEDTRVLLSHPTVVEALRRRVACGRLTIVLGESCKPFAERELLPAALLTLKRFSTSVASVTVTYAFPAAPSTRPIRTDLLAPEHADMAAGSRHLLTLHLPDGRPIPDGFSGGGGTVLGLLNGADTEILSRLAVLFTYL
jgi:hypothetical protein